MKLTKLIIYNLGVFLALFILIEIGFKVVNPGYVYYERTYAAKFEEKAIHKLDTNWVALDDDLGWVCKRKEHLKFYRSDFFELSYQINKQGFRNAHDFDSIQASAKKRILLIGDSFLFGIFLQNEETISAQLQKQLGDGYEVFNLAIPGWGIDQMYQAYAKYIEQIAPDQVILFYIDDDISRTIEALYWGAGSKKAYKIEGEKLIARKPTDGKLNIIESFFVFSSQIINRLYKIKCFQKAEPLAKAILQKMIQSEQNHNRKLTAIRFPRIEQIGNDGLHFFDLKPFFVNNQCSFSDIEKKMRLLPNYKYADFYISEDDHPSAKGARYITTVLKGMVID